MAFVADLKNYRRVFDPETGWECLASRGATEASPAAMALLPPEPQYKGARRYVFLRNGAEYLPLIGAHANYRDLRIAVAFVRDELESKWQGLPAAKAAIAPDIQTFEDFVRLVARGVKALETLPPPASQFGATAEIIVA